MAALEDPANLKIISDAYHNAIKTGVNPVQGSVTQQQSVPNVLQNARKRIIQQPGVSVP